MEPTCNWRCTHMILIILILLHSSVRESVGQQEVTLNSTLIRGHLALPGQTVVFTCVTRNSTILEWQSNDYIGRGGDGIQIYGVGSRNNVTSFSNPNSYATRVSVRVENGITVIVSQLFITASEQFPTSSVTCRINGQGPRRTIFFNTTATALQEIKLNSTLIRGNLAFPGQRVVFTCVTRNGTILEWQSDDYIGQGGDGIQIYGVGSRNNVTSFSNPNSYATRVSVRVENGITKIVSQLFITASEQFPTSSVTCRINGQGPRRTISFNTKNENLPVPKLNSTLHEGASACPSERHMFKCAASHSHNIEWTSEEYIGGHLQISSSSPVSAPLRASGNKDTYAVLESVELENGGFQLTSSLNIMVSPSIADQNHTVTCLNVDLGTQQSITFQIAGLETCITEIEITTTTVTRTNNDSEVKGDKEGATTVTSPLAAIIGGSIFVLIFILAISTVIIVVVIVCTKKALSANAQVLKIDVEKHMKNQGDSPQLYIEDLTVRENSGQTMIPVSTTPRANDGTLNDSGSSSVGKGLSPNSSPEHEPHSPVPPTFNWRSSNQLEDEN